MGVRARKRDRHLLLPLVRTCNLTAQSQTVERKEGEDADARLLNRRVLQRDGLRRNLRGECETNYDNPKVPATH